MLNNTKHFIGIISCLASLLGIGFSQNISQTSICKQGEIVPLKADYKTQFLQSPFKKDKVTYPAKVNCSYLITSDLDYTGSRILIHILQLKLEEPLFNVCRDYLAVYDGNNADGPQLFKNCGAVQTPFSITSRTGSIFLQFVTDELIELNGFTLTYEVFHIPGCPPEWIPTPDGKSCLNLFPSPAYDLSYADAQQICIYNGANLITFETPAEYEISNEIYHELKSIVWIGYNDMVTETKFTSISNDNATYFPFASSPYHNNEVNDCLLLSFPPNESFTFATDDCRKKFPFICKRSLDDSTQTVIIYPRTVRDGFYGSDYSPLVTFFIIVAVFAFLLIIYLLYKWIKNHCVTRVSNLDQNNMLFQQHDSVPASHMTNVATAPSQNQRSSVTRTKEIKNGATLTSSIPKNYAAAKFDMTSNQPDPALVSNTSSVVDEVFESKNIEAAHHETKPGPSGLMKIKVSPGNENHVAPSSSHIIVNEVGAIPKSSVIANEFNSPYSGHIIPAQVEKEVPFSLSVVQEQYFDTEVVTNTIYTDDHNTTDIITNTNTMIIKPPEADTLSDKNKILSFSIESPKSSFNRPRISVLKNVSAISLDDFWKNP